MFHACSISGGSSKAVLRDYLRIRRRSSSNGSSNSNWCPIINKLGVYQSWIDTNGSEHVTLYPSEKNRTLVFYPPFPSTIVRHNELHLTKWGLADWNKNHDMVQDALGSAPYLWPWTHVQWSEQLTWVRWGLYDVTVYDVIYNIELWSLGVVAFKDDTVTMSHFNHWSTVASASIGFGRSVG
jgi:hypothetical protein